jgi:hypothetical protein
MVPKDKQSNGDITPFAAASALAISQSASAEISRREAIGAELIDSSPSSTIVTCPSNRQRGQPTVKCGIKKRGAVRLWVSGGTAPGLAVRGKHTSPIRFLGEAQQRGYDKPSEASLSCVHDVFSFAGRSSPTDSVMMSLLGRFDQAFDCRQTTTRKLLHDPRHALAEMFGG